MKMYLTLAVLILFTIDLCAQVQKGDWSLNGTTALNQTWSGEDGFDGFSITLNPALSIMVNDHWLLGGAIGTFQNTNLDLADNSFVQPEVRYYLNPYDEQRNFFLSFVPSFNFGEFESSAYNMSAGFNQFLNKNIALETTANYTINGNSFNILSLNLGLRSFLKKEDRSDWQSAVPEFNTGSLLLGQGLASISYFREIFQFNISPSVGYFLTPQWVIGGQLSAFYSISGQSNRNARSSSFSLAPFMRYYLYEQKHWLWFLEAGGSYDWSSSRFQDAFKTSRSLGQLFGALGSNWFLSSNLAFEFRLQGSYGFPSNINIENLENLPFIQDQEGSLDDDRFSLGLQVGLNYFIQRNK